MRYTERLILRLTATQAGDIRHAARTSGLTPSAWLRRVAAGATVSDDFTPRADTLIGKLDQLNALLLALGRNFNQLARAANLHYNVRVDDALLSEAINLSKEARGAGKRAANLLKEKTR